MPYFRMQHIQVRNTINWICLCKKSFCTQFLIGSRCVNNAETACSHEIKSVLSYFFMVALAAEGEMEAVEVEKMVKLAEQCLERVKSCIGKRSDTSDQELSTAPVQARSCTRATGPRKSGEPSFPYSR